MKTNNIYTLLATILLSVFILGVTACGSDDDGGNGKDMTYPVISTEGITANPIDCQVYHRGDVIPFCYLFTDDMELGAYNIEIHSNFDHHTHSHSSVECHHDHEEEEADTEPANPWVFNRSYIIPAGQRSYKAQLDIPIPADITPGDYHFMVRLTDRAGWQQLHAVAIEIED